MNRPHSTSAPRRPVIGITPDYNEKPAEGVTPRYELKQAYTDAVIKAGGLPMVVAYSEDPTVVDSYLDRMSGLVVTGGAFDIPPEAYGEQQRDGLGALRAGRTAFETSLMRAALKRNMPVLGVCGGMQLLNVVLGGTLFQDILREVQNAKDHEQKHDRAQPSHPVDVKDGTVLAECVGRGQLMVNSTHHQAVNRVGEKVVVSAVSPDGVVEAIESKEHGFALGVQWHPELMVTTVPIHLGVYKVFVHKAREQRR